MYTYIQKKELRSNLRNYCEEIILRVQSVVKDYFTFSFKLIGSGDNRLMMVNGKDDSIDLDYNLIIHRDKKRLVGSPKEIKRLFMSAFKEKCGAKAKVSDSTQVITCEFGRLYGHEFSMDVAILIEGNDGYLYKLINDKNVIPSRYIWNKIPKSKGFEYKLASLKRLGYWQDIKDLYLRKKNNNLSRQTGKSSFSILVETINEIIQKNGLDL